MEPDMIQSHLENLDRRLARVEQILPGLATKEDLKALATKEELKALATKEELRAAIALLATKEELRAAIAPLATREELRAATAPLATKEELRELRRHMDVLSESQRGDIQMLAEHLASERRRPRKE